jgi:hypothetical protein
LSVFVVSILVLKKYISSNKYRVGLCFGENFNVVGFMSAGVLLSQRGRIMEPNHSNSSCLSSQLMFYMLQKDERGLYVH